MLISVRPCAVKNQTRISYGETQSRHAEDLVARTASRGLEMGEEIAEHYLRQEV